MTEMHTPTPWRVKPGTAIIEQFKDGLWGLIVADCRMTDEGEANAAFIVEAVAALTRPAPSSPARIPKPGECPDYAGMICRRFYPGDSACQQFGGKQKCLLDLREAALASSPALDPKTVEACANIAAVRADKLRAKAKSQTMPSRQSYFAQSIEARVIETHIRALIGQPAPTGDSE